MLLAKGQTVHIRKQKFVGILPDNIVQIFNIPEDTNNIEKLKKRDKNYKPKDNGKDKKVKKEK